MSMKYRQAVQGLAGVRTQILTIQDDITADLNAHIADYSDPHHNFTGLTVNHIPKKSGSGLADSLVSESGSVVDVNGFIQSDETVDQDTYPSIYGNQTASTLQDGSAGNTGTNEDFDNHKMQQI